MRNNVEKVLERDQKLGDLEDRSGLVLLYAFESYSFRPAEGWRSALREEGS